MTEQLEIVKEFESGFTHSCALCSMTSCSEDSEKLGYVSRRMAEEIVRLRKGFEYYKETLVPAIAEPLGNNVELLRQRLSAERAYSEKLREALNACVEAIEGVTGQSVVGSLLWVNVLKEALEIPRPE